MLREALFLGTIFLTLNASEGSTEFLTPSTSVQIPQTFPVLPALRGRKLGSWHKIRRKRLKRVGTEDASAQDDLAPATAKVLLLLRGDSQELSEVLLPSP